MIFHGFHLNFLFQNHTAILSVVPACRSRCLASRVVENGWQGGDINHLSRTKNGSWVKFYQFMNYLSHYSIYIYIFIYVYIYIYTPCGNVT